MHHSALSTGFFFPGALVNKYRIRGTNLIYEVEKLDMATLLWDAVLGCWRLLSHNSWIAQLV